MAVDSTLQIKIRVYVAIVDAHMLKIFAPLGASIVCYAERLGHFATSLSDQVDRPHNTLLRHPL